MAQKKYIGTEKYTYTEVCGSCGEIKKVDINGECKQCNEIMKEFRGIK